MLCSRGLNRVKLRVVKSAINVGRLGEISICFPQAMRSPGPPTTQCADNLLVIGQSRNEHMESSCIL